MSLCPLAYDRDAQLRRVPAVLGGVPRRTERHRGRDEQVHGSLHGVHGLGLETLHWERGSPEPSASHGSLLEALLHKWTLADSSPCRRYGRSARVGRPGALPRRHRHGRLRRVHGGYITRHHSGEGQADGDQAHCPSLAGALKRPQASMDCKSDL